MENKAHAWLAGLFTVGLVVAAVLFALWLNKDNVERVPYELATKSSIPGLNPQAAVRYRGLDIGRVENITFDPKVMGQIIIRIKINKDAPITQSTYAALGYQGVTGIAYIEMDDDGTNPVPKPSSEQDVARIELRQGFTDKLAQEGTEILEKLNSLSTKLNKLTEENNQKKLMEAIDNMSIAAQKLGTIPDQIAPTFSRITKKHGAMDQLESAIEDLQFTTNNIGKQTLPRIDSLANDARTTLRKFDRNAERLKRNPQSFLFGAQKPRPGPGEEGFSDRDN